MANLIYYITGILPITTICLIQPSSAIKPAMLAQLIEDEEHNNNQCSLKIIKNTAALKYITIVNVKNNKFLDYIYSLNIKTQVRTFLATRLKQHNEAYVVHCDNLEECENGFDDLIKDIYWNPSATFFVTVKHFSCCKEDFFRKLHYLYVFKTVLVLHDYIFFYDFQLGEHCNFTVNAIKEYKCDSISSENSPIWADVKASLEERHKTPYSGCNISVIVSILVPLVFTPLDTHDEPFGYEEEFIRILKRINFTNISISYNSNLTRNGLVCENHTASGFLALLQRGAIDYLLGGTILSHYRLQVFDFTYPHFFDDFVLIVPKARQIDKWEVMYKVFNPLVWGLISLAFACVTLVAYFIQFSCNRDLYHLVLTTLDMFSYLTNNPPKKKITCFVLSWALFAWLILSFYQSDLTSIFTRPMYFNQVNSLPEILSDNYKLYLSRAKYNYMKGSAELDMGGLVQKSTICKNDLDALKAVAYERKRFTVVSTLNYLYSKAEFYNDKSEAMLHKVL
ncbi:uncharacterized protein LOC134669285 [Cydia fagiglandana]|uniref:uncharacterized protein LOC134669285 n=1 Tax=Cydia fagiglandana TaxID=1458189 RepID=UPI002FEE27D4